MEATTHKPGPSFVEFVIIISTMMSLTALSTDAMLPALPQIGSDLGVVNDNERQLVVSTIFMGIAIGQLIFGPLSDRTGRKPGIYAGLSLYMVGALLSAFAVNFPMMLAGRFIQGLGLSGPRAILLALVRDKYAGRRMARVMSFVTTVLILIPMVAPTLGQAILLFSSWRGIYIAFVIMAALTVTWFGLRMPETLTQEKRAPFTLKRIIDAAVEILKIRVSIGYTLSAGLISGAFLGYLNSTQQILQELYGLGELFPLVFAIIAFSIGCASFLNARLVMRFGMRFLIRWSLAAIISLSAVALVVALLSGGQPPLWFLMAYLMATFFGVGVLFGNQNSLAMEPLGHLAGIGSAVVGSMSTFISIPLGTLIGQRYDGTVRPLILGLFVLSGLSMLVVRWVESDPTKHLATGQEV